MSRVEKYLRAARPRANQKSEAPIIIVLSTSKNAAAVGSGVDGGRSLDLGGRGGRGPGDVRAGLLGDLGSRRAAAERQTRHGDLPWVLDPDTPRLRP